MRNSENRLAQNNFFSLLQQAVTLICGLILPQMILESYGSAVNGTIASITQFLTFITLLQGGVAAVARLAYYKPLAYKDNHQISIAYKTVSSFFKRFAVVFTAYMFLLALTYPLLIKTDFSYGYVFSLVIVVGFASVSEYFFGQAAYLLLFSDQKGYICSIIQVACLVISTIICTIMINLGASIHAVKLVYGMVFTIKPIAFYAVVHKHYQINNKVSEDKKLFTQRNAALVRNIAFYIHTSTDVILLSLLTNVYWVSVYSVHRYVTNSLSNMLISMFGNTEVIYGKLFALNDYKTLERQVPIYDLMTKLISTIFFVTCIILITPFVAIYTKGINDADYYQPIFAIVLSLGEMVYCMSITYQSIYGAAGHIKSTQWIAILEAIINLGLSLILIKKYNILGVAIGTLVAMVFKSIANMVYMQKRVLHISNWYIAKSYCVDIIIGGILSWSLICHPLYTPHGYVDFFLYAILIFAIVSAVLTVGNYIFFKEYMIVIFNKIRR